MRNEDTPWHATACCLCYANCGVKVQLDPEGRSIVRVRGDRDHPASKGYTCNKALHLDAYQNGRDRLDTPLRRRADGSFEPIDWDTAIREIAAKLGGIRDEHGGTSILYYGGGGQGNHLGGGYNGAVQQALGMRYRSNALAQEKTGLAWVSQRTVGGFWHGDFEHCDVALIVGKNPWQSNGMQRARIHKGNLSRAGPPAGGVRPAAHGNGRARGRAHGRAPGHGCVVPRGDPGPARAVRRREPGVAR
jgi:formate dehydrogenase